MSTGGSERVKVVFDRTVATLGLLICLPLLGVIALAVRFDSPGPVLFRQQRVGRGGRPFAVLKFRTMVAGADRLAANVTPAGDPRVTRVGAVLRRWYLDELPQLVNVVRGEMSLVGPRPETPEFVAEFTPEERALLTVRPGLVGPSTLAFMDEAEVLAGSADPVACYRHRVLHARLRCDLTYLRHRSLAGDIGILFRQLARIVTSATHTGHTEGPTES